MAYSSKTTVSTKYRVSGGNSVISTTFSSPFEAIGRAFKVGGKVTETDSGVTIFESNTTKYYLFQFTNFYGSTASRTEADSWINDYANAHVIYGGTGKLYGSNAKVLKGGLFRTEATNGAYLYNSVQLKQRFLFLKLNYIFRQKIVLIMHIYTLPQSVKMVQKFMKQAL